MLYRTSIKLFKAFFATYKWNSYKEIIINKWQYETNFMRSSGPGGQSVNTTNSKAQVRLKLSECAAVDENIMNNLRANHSNSISKNNQLVVRSQVHKSQGKNLDQCFEKIQKILYQCSIVREEKSQVPFVQPEQVREKRLESKKKRSQVKSNRQRKNFDF